MLNVQDITDYLRKTVELGGSDLHIISGMPPLIRHNGKIKAIDEIELSRDDCQNLTFSALTETQRAVLEKEWELDFAIQVKDVGRFRGNAHYSRSSIHCSYRHIKNDIPDLHTLGHYPIVEELCNLHQGLVLVTGYTGSGKTTTLASMIKEIAKKLSGVIITIEDPIEFVHEHNRCIIKQREVGSDTKSFSKALRQSLRQDPDVIVVSELRDLETIQTAITAAETGHLVLGTLHTNDAPKSLDRLIDVFPSDQQPQIITQLANVLQAVISQKLLENKKGDGRVLATEIMVMNYGIKAVLRDRKVQQILGLMQIGAKDGMHTIDDSLANLLKLGKISKETAFKYCRDKNFLELKSRGK